MCYIAIATDKQRHIQLFIIPFLRKKFLSGFRFSLTFSLLG